MPPCTGGIQCRVSSPPGPSTLMTTAPRSPRIWVQNGPASTREKSATSSPESGPGRWAGVWFIGGQVTRAAVAAPSAGERKAGRRLPASVEANGETREARDGLDECQAFRACDSEPGCQRVGEAEIRSGHARRRNPGRGQARVRVDEVRAALVAARGRDRTGELDDLSQPAGHRRVGDADPERL